MILIFVLANPYSLNLNWIELLNTDSQPLDLSGYSITDNTFIKQQYVFPAGTVVPANGYLVIFVDGEVRKVQISMFIILRRILSASTFTQISVWIQEEASLPFMINSLT